MNDRELLELAAKALGFQIEGWAVTGHAYIGSLRLWNTLIDDGDAFRAANHAGLTIGQAFDGAYVDLCCGEILQKMPGGGCQHEVKWSEFDGDKNAACRKAITLCLAQIGSVMS